MPLRGYDAQAALIGSLLIDPETLAGEIMQRVKPTDFTDSAIRSLFTAARELYLDQKRIDPVTVLDRAGREYHDLVSEILRQTPTAANWESYAAIVKNKAQLLKLRNVAHQVLECEKAEDARELLLQAQSLLAQRESIKIFTYRDMLNGLLDRVQDKTPPTFLDWGFPQLNEILYITQGRFVVLAAESSVGKTAFALQIARGLAKSGKRVGFFSLETSQEDATDRLAANAADVNLGNIKQRRIDSRMLSQIVEEFKASGDAPLELIEAAGCTVDEIRALTLMRRYDVIFVDYVQLISAPGNQPSEQVRAISMGLHTLALQLGVTVVGLSQVTPPPKNQKGQRPPLSKENLRESHQLIHDAEAILILDLTDLSDFGSNRMLKIDKNKDGPCGKMLLGFDARHMRFYYVPPYEDPDQLAADKRNAVMDQNRADRKAKEAAKSKTAIKDQGSIFEGRPDDGPLPF